MFPKYPWIPYRLLSLSSNANSSSTATASIPSTTRRISLGFLKEKHWSNTSAPTTVSKSKDLAAAMHRDFPSILDNSDSVGKHVCIWVHSSETGYTIRKKIYNKVVSITLFIQTCMSKHTLQIYLKDTFFSFLARHPHPPPPFMITPNIQSW